MGFTRQQISVGLSIIFLIATTALAAYAVSAVNRRSLPIRASLGAFTTILPAISGLSVQSVLTANRSRRRRNKNARGLSTATVIVLFLLTVYETVVVTLAGTHIGPVSDLTCGLDEQWQRLYHTKDGNAIRRIQDKYQCCGLHSSVDRAWPFPDKHHDVHSCSKTYDRTKPCFAEWRGAEQRVAAMLLMVPILVFAWQVIVLASPSSRSSWMSEALPDQLTDGTVENGGPSRSIEYQPRVAEVYSDEPTAEDAEVAQEPLPPLAIEGRPTVTNRSATTGHIESNPVTENEWARE